MKHILFICSKNRLRSPTAEQVFANHEGIECASAGVSRDADNHVTPQLLNWADTIFVMERIHKTKLCSKFQKHLRNKRIICLDIPDNYEFMEDGLVELLKSKVERFL